MFIHLFMSFRKMASTRMWKQTLQSKTQNAFLTEGGLKLLQRRKSGRKSQKNKVTLKKKIHKAKKSVCSVDVEISLDKKLQKEEKHYPHDGALDLQCLCVVYTDSRDTHTHTQLKTRERFPCFSCFLMRPQLPSGAESAPWPPPDLHTDTLNNFWRTL